MVKQLWYPKANKSQLYAGGIEQATVSKLVLHSTEGTTFPGYGGGTSAPTFTIRPDFSTKSCEIRQHFPANVSAKALVDKTGGVRTNRDDVAQIEIVGTSGWATTRNPNRTYTLAEQWYVPGYPDWFWNELSLLVKWYHDEWDLPYKTIPFPDWNASGSRLSDEAYDAFTGVLGHSHVPENDHTDPGAIPSAKLINLAQSHSTATKELTMEDVSKIVTALARVESKIGTNNSASDAFSKKNALALANISYGDITIGQAIAEMGRWAREQNRIARDKA